MVHTVVSVPSTKTAKRPSRLIADVGPFARTPPSVPQLPKVYGGGWGGNERERVVTAAREYVNRAVLAENSRRTAGQIRKHWSERGPVLTWLMQRICKTASEAVAENAHPAAAGVHRYNRAPIEIAAERRPARPVQGGIYCPDMPDAAVSIDEDFDAPVRVRNRRRTIVHEAPQRHPAAKCSAGRSLGNGPECMVLSGGENVEIARGVRGYRRIINECGP